MNPCIFGIKHEYRPFKRRKLNTFIGPVGCGQIAHKTTDGNDGRGLTDAVAVQQGVADFNATSNRNCPDILSFA